MVSVTLIIDFPSSAPKKEDKDVPITVSLLQSLHIHPALMDELMKGVGQGSMHGSGKRDDQAMAKLGTKTFEVSTALVRDKPISLELSCTYMR